MTALNAAYDVEETRPAWQRYPLSVVYAIGPAVLTIIAAGLLNAGPLMTHWFAGQFQPSWRAALFWTWHRWPLMVAVLLLVFANIYKVAPNIDQPFRYVTPGSVVGVTAWIVASLGFSLYAQNFGNYGATYGSLGGIVVLLLYFFVSSAVLRLRRRGQCRHPPGDGSPGGRPGAGDGRAAGFFTPGPGRDTPTIGCPRLLNSGGAGWSSFGQMGSAWLCHPA